MTDLSRCWCCKGFIWFVDGRWVHGLMRVQIDDPEPHIASPDPPHEDRARRMGFAPDGSRSRR